MNEIIGRLYPSRRTLIQRIKFAWIEFKKKYNDDGIPIVISDNVQKDSALVFMPTSGFKKLKKKRIIK